MHWSLSRWFNVAVTIVWGLLLIAVLRTTKPFPIVELAAGALLGFIAGHLQDRAISANPGGFLGAQTGLGVRRALIGVPAGKWSIILLWVNSAVLLVWAMAFAPDMFVGAWLSGVSVFGLTRELAAFPGVMRLANESKAGG
jgi:hypothetical protein